MTTPPTPTDKIGYFSYNGTVGELRMILYDNNILAMDAIQRKVRRILDKYPWKEPKHD